MGRPGAGALGDGPAGQVALHGKKDAVIGDLAGLNMGKDCRMTELEAAISEMGSRMDFGNPPHPAVTGPAARKEGESRGTDPRWRKKPRAHGGGHGNLRHHKAAGAVHRTPNGCRAGLRGSGPQAGGMEAVWAMPHIPMTECVANATDGCRCGDCGTVTGAGEDPAGVPGTNTGPRAVRLPIGAEAGCGMQSVRNLPGFFGTDACMAAVRQAPGAGAA